MHHALLLPNFLSLYSMLLDRRNVMNKYTAAIFILFSVAMDRDMIVIATIDLHLAETCPC